MMESICRLGSEDIFRLCSAIFDVLSTGDSLKMLITQTNFVRKTSSKCLKKYVIADNGELQKVNALKCSIEKEDEDITPIYALADPRERGSAFVLNTNEMGDLKLHARVIKIGALLYPFGPKEVKLHTDPINESPSTAQFRGSITGRASGSDKRRKRPQ